MLNTLMLRLCSKIGELLRPSIENVVTLLHDEQDDSAAATTTSSASDIISRGSGMSRKGKVNKLRDFLFTKNNSESVFMNDWFIPAFVSHSVEDPLISELVCASSDYNSQFLEFDDKCSEKYKNVLADTKARISKEETRTGGSHIEFAKALFRKNLEYEHNAKELGEIRMFLQAREMKRVNKIWKEIVRHVSRPGGTWTYNSGCRIFSLFEQDGLDDQKDNDKDGVFGYTDENARISWKEDMSHSIGFMRPFMKYEFRKNFVPRDESEIVGSKLRSKPAPAPSAKDISGVVHAKKPSSDSLQEGEDEGEGIDEWCIVDEGKKDTAEEGKPEAPEKVEPEDSTMLSSSSISGYDASEVQSDGFSHIIPRADEPFIFVCPCSRVYLVDKTPGHLCLTETRLFFFKQGDTSGVRGFKEWQIKDISCLYNRRFVASSAMELFLESTGRGYLFEFPSKQSLQKMASLLSQRASAISGRKIELLKDPRKVLKKENIVGMWQKHEITNFEYLMALNTLAGRSFNDVAQYPVFPWVISDYKSSTIDWTNPMIFRDLSKPIGALNPDRLEVFLQRFREMKVDESATAAAGTVPPFLYGSHYSTVGAVTFWLTRLEPISSVARELQDGGFDYADRLFFSLSTAWENCLSSSSDVKELVPEFFRQPEFLMNLNRYWLGRRQNSSVVDDVQLPSWAKDSPELFVRFNAEALESPFVSTHLHEWIDLIFGYKQRGKAAEAANNVFYYLTYPDAVDESALEGNSVDAAALRAQLAYFGQCPTQLFSHPHPQRMPLVSSTLGTLSASSSFSEQNVALISDTHSVTIRMRLLSSIPKVPLCASAACDTLALLFPDTTVRTAQIPARGLPPSECDLAGSAIQRLNNPDIIVDVLPVLLGGPFVINSSYPGYIIAPTIWGKSLCVTSSTSGAIYQLEDTSCLGNITALASSLDGRRLALGGATGSVLLPYVEPSSAGKAPSVKISSALMIREHMSPVTAVAFDPSGSFCVTGALDGSIGIHLTDTGRTVASIMTKDDNLTSSQVVGIAVARNTDFAVIRRGKPYIWIYTCNGNLVDCVDLADFTSPVSIHALQSGTDTSKSDMFVVVDARGISLVSSLLFTLPSPRVVKRWPVPPSLNGYQFRYGAFFPSDSLSRPPEPQSVFEVAVPTQSTQQQDSSSSDSGLISSSAAVSASVSSASVVSASVATSSSSPTQIPKFASSFDHSSRSAHLGGFARPAVTPITPSQHIRAQLLVIAESSLPHTPDRPRCAIVSVSFVHNIPK